MLVQIPFFCQGSLRRLFAFFFECHLCLVFGSCIFGSRHDIFICKQLLLWLASCHIWREEWQTNKEKGKTCLFTGKADVQHMPFTCVTDDSDSPDNSLHDNKILTITNLSVKNKRKKCSVQYFLNFSYRYSLLKRQQRPDGPWLLHKS